MGSVRCYACGEMGHRAFECTKGYGKGKSKGKGKDMKGKGKGVYEVDQEDPWFAATQGDRMDLGGTVEEPDRALRSG